MKHEANILDVPTSHPQRRALEATSTRTAKRQQAGPIRIQKGPLFIILCLIYMERNVLYQILKVSQPRHVMICLMYAK